MRKLVDRIESAGLHRIEWNGQNGNQQSVSSGINIYKMIARKLETGKPISDPEK